jgi:hypothetical protein
MTSIADGTSTKGVSKPRLERLPVEPYGLAPMVTAKPPVGRAPIPPRVPGHMAGSRATTFFQTRGRLSYVHPPAGWAPMLPCVPELVADFLLSAPYVVGSCATTCPWTHVRLPLSAPLRVGSPYHYMSPNSWPTFLSTPLWGGLPCHHEEHRTEGDSLSDGRGG